MLKTGTYKGRLPWYYELKKKQLYSKRENFITPCQTVITVKNRRAKLKK